MNRKVAGLVLSCMGTFAAVVQASPLVDQVTLVKAASAANVPLPSDTNNQAGVSFTVTQAGSYTITVTDLLLPGALQALNVALASSTASVAQISAAGTHVSQNVTLAAGDYTVQPLATAATGSLGGTFSALVSGPGGFQWQDVWTVSAARAPTPPGESILSTQFNVSDAGNYTLTLADDDFPQALSSVQLIILNSSGSPVVPTPIRASAPVSAVAQLSLPAGSYDLFVYAQASTPAYSGLYALRIAGGSSGNSVAFAASEPVGNLGAPIPIVVPSAETVELRLNDLVYPLALSSLQALVSEGANILARVPASTGATPAPLSALAGTAQLYVLPVPSAGGQGAYAAYATAGGATLADVAEPVLDSSHYGYTYATPAPLSAASYQLDLNDYGEPLSFASLSAAVEQQGALVANSQTQTASSPSTFTALAGPATILVFPKLQAAADDSLFGVELLSSLGVVAFNTTQGVGATFSSTTVAIPGGGTYVLQATDLAFPAAFNNLAVILTSGQSVVSEVFGAGQVPVTVNAPGNYVLNVLAQVGTGTQYGLYGFNFAQGQPPTATLTAMPASVASGGQTLLTWSSTYASSCTASGGWSGALATSGSQQSPAVTTATTFVINCTGAAGIANASVNVALTAAKSGGGGAFDAGTLLALLVPTLWLLRRRNSTRG